jgi:hypothetical protein
MTAGRDKPERRSYRLFTLCRSICDARPKVRHPASPSSVLVSFPSPISHPLSLSKQAEDCVGVAESRKRQRKESRMRISTSGGAASTGSNTPVLHCFLSSGSPSPILSHLLLWLQQSRDAAIDLKRCNLFIQVMNRSYG